MTEDSILIRAERLIRGDIVLWADGSAWPRIPRPRSWNWLWSVSAMTTRTSVLLSVRTASSVFCT